MLPGGGGFFPPKKKKSSGCRQIPRNQRIARQGQGTMFLLIQVHFCFIKPPQQHRRFAAVAKKRHLPPADRMPRSTKAPHALTIAFVAFSVSSPWTHVTHTTCIQRNFDVCAPALSSQPAHTTRHNFGYTNSHTATKILACGSWRCSSLCTHPRSLFLTDLGCTCASALAPSRARAHPPLTHTMP